MRGDEPAEATIRERMAGITPTCVGMNREALQSSEIRCHYPHMRGDEPMMDTARMQKLHYPHMRGDEPRWEALRAAKR